MRYKYVCEFPLSRWTESLAIQEVAIFLFVCCELIVRGKLKVPFLPSDKELRIVVYSFVCVVITLLSVRYALYQLQRAREYQSWYYELTDWYKALPDDIRPVAPWENEKTGEGHSPVQADAEGSV